MVCKQCKKEGRESSIQDSVGTTTTAYYPAFFDNDGKRHHHDRNVTTTQYICSNGHSWVESTTGSCWCGWPEKGGECDI